MKFRDFIKNGQAKKCKPDIQLAKALYKNTLNDLIYLKSQKIDKISARKIISNYYDCLRSILEAISSLDGYKIYQHEAFVYFLKEKGENLSSLKFDRFRRIRNKLNYYGKDISISQASDLKKDIIELIRFFELKYIKGKLKWTKFS